MRGKSLPTDPSRQEARRPMRAPTRREATGILIRTAAMEIPILMETLTRTVTTGTRIPIATTVILILMEPIRTPTRIASHRNICSLFFEQ
ncbi:hypothetical protein ACFFQF_07795 [Haladaptatus pallidirubidus]|uniref:hypothetical protein n=1 Tax=Haladaptatus pallidirubidus TaxID=1008152 RepID=UPI0035E742AF